MAELEATRKADENEARVAAEMAEKAVAEKTCIEAAKYFEAEAKAVQVRKQNMKHYKNLKQTCNG